MLRLIAIIISTVLVGFLLIYTNLNDNTKIIIGTIYGLSAADFITRNFYKKDLITYIFSDENPT